MFEDDIQYIGTRLAKDGFSPSRPFSAEPESPSGKTSLKEKLYLRTHNLRRLFHLGIVLHVEQCGDEKSYELYFPRNKAPDGGIQIGRKPPSSDPERRQKDAEAGKAMFKCPVVSRKHAKITFSETGQVRLA